LDRGKRDQHHAASHGRRGEAFALHNVIARNLSQAKRRLRSLATPS
jgi:hypothetical protein